MEDLTSKLPKEIGFDWTALSYQERQAGAQAAPLYAFSILIIFLCVAALYESGPFPSRSSWPFHWGPSVVYRFRYAGMPMMSISRLVF